jgi:hypothetical protein
MPLFDPRPGPLVAAAVVAVALAACGTSVEPPRPAARTASPLSVGRPIAPRRVTVPGPGKVELRALSPTRSGRPTWLAIVLSTPGADPRDVCVATGLARRSLGEANTYCAVRTPRDAASFVARDGIPDRDGAAPIVVSGVAPPGVRAVRLTGAAGTRTLPLSAHRAFLAVLAPSVRGRVRVVSVGRTGVATRSFVLPLPPRWSLRRSRHPHRRPGAVFDDEVGENILLRSYEEIVRRFGAPAAQRTEHGRRCAYYEVVGRARDGWRFCFAGDGRMLSAGGNGTPP